MIFFTSRAGVRGAVCSDLCTQLFFSGCNGHILDWSQSYTQQALQLYDRLADCWVTTGGGLEVLVHEYHIHPNKIWLVNHTLADVQRTLDQEACASLVKDCAGYAVVSTDLQKIAQEKCSRQMQLTPVGVDFARFRMPIPDRLQKIGYVGSSYTADEAFSNPNSLASSKRSWLIKEVAEATGLTVDMSSPYFDSARCLIPGFYRGVDAIMVASTHEGTALSLLEGGAAGRLLISSGLHQAWSERYAADYVDFVPMPAEEYKEAAIKLLIYYRDNPEAYRQRCFQIRDNCQQNDWKTVAPRWLEFLSGVHP